MKAVIQRVSRAKVTVEEEVTGKIENGLLVLLGVTHEDTKEKADYLVNKILNLRIFQDENDKMNLSVKDINGEILVVSQFTLYADTSSRKQTFFYWGCKTRRSKYAL